MDILFKYYGIDWTAMVMTCCFLYYVGEEKRSGFVFGILASIAWLAFGILAESIANVIANLIFITLNARGYLKWKKKSSTSGVIEILPSRELETYISGQHNGRNTLHSYSALENISSISFFRLMRGRL